MAPRCLTIKSQTIKGQTALEFLVLTGFMLMVFSGFFFVMQERTTKLRSDANYMEIISIADTLRQETALANQVRGGYSRTFELPQTVNGEPYEVYFAKDGSGKISLSEIVISTTELEYLLFIPANVTMSVGNLINQGKNNMSKLDNGTILLTPYP